MGSVEEESGYGRIVLKCRSVMDKRRELSADLAACTAVASMQQDCNPIPTQTDNGVILAWLEDSGFAEPARIGKSARQSPQTIHHPPFTRRCNLRTDYI